MALNLNVVGVPGEPQERSWTATDALLYAIGVGAGLGDPLHELEFTTENSIGIEQQVLPTFAVLIAQARPGGGRLGRLRPGPARPRRAGLRAAPPAARGGHRAHHRAVTGIYDKGSGALVVTENRAVDAATGEPLVTSRSGMFIRGQGGFGGPRGESAPWQLPERAPDVQITQQTRPEQALLYRLSGRPQPAARRPAVRRPRRLPAADPARPVHLRVHRPGAAARAVRLRPGPVPVHVRPVQLARCCRATR